MAAISAFAQASQLRAYQAKSSPSTALSASSSAFGAAQKGYDNDEWAQQSAGSSRDSLYGKSYDSVAANEYTDEQYARGQRAKDNQSAFRFNSWGNTDLASSGAAKSAATSAEEGG